jgi:hypothetical protein
MCKTNYIFIVGLCHFSPVFPTILCFAAAENFACADGGMEGSK